MLCPKCVYYAEKEESVCPKCGYTFEIQPEPVIIPRELPEE